MLAIAARKLEHSVIKAVEASESDKLEFVIHRAEFSLEGSDGRLIQIGAPVEGGRTVVCEQLTGELAVNSARKLTRLFEIGLGRLPPKNVSMAGEGQPSFDAVRKSCARLQAVKTFRCVPQLETHGRAHRYRM